MPYMPVYTGKSGIPAGRTMVPWYLGIVWIVSSRLQCSEVPKISNHRVNPLWSKGRPFTAVDGPGGSRCFGHLRALQATGNIPNDPYVQGNHRTARGDTRFAGVYSHIRMLTTALLHVLK